MSPRASMGSGPARHTCTMARCRRVGIAGALDAGGTYRFRPGYRPWSTPAIYDATTPGRSNRGHAREFEALSEAARDALLEYLKLL